MNPYDQPLPANLDAERACLGACLLDLSRMPELETLLPDGRAEFSSAAHGAVYEGLGMYVARFGVDGDPLRLAEHARSEGIDELADVTILVPLVSAVPSGQRMPHYAKIVHDTYRLRIAANHAAEVWAAAVDDRANVVDVLAVAQAGFDRIRDLAQDDGLSDSSLGAILAAPETWTLVAHVPTGFRELDDALGGGLRVGGVHLIGGLSGRGKTQFAVALALNAARAGTAVGFLSLEMPRRDLGHVVAASLAGIPRGWLDKSDVRGQPAERLSRVTAEARAWPLTIMDDSLWRGPLTRSRLAEIVADGVRRFGWRLVVVDYLGLISPEADDRSDYFSEVATSGTLKRLASEHDLAVAVLADLRKSAAFEKKTERAQTVSLDDFRGAARLTYDATSVLYLDSEQVENAHGGEPTGIIKLVALKSRYTAAGARRTEVQLRWFPSTARIVDLEHEPTFNTELDSDGDVCNTSDI